MFQERGFSFFADSDVSQFVPLEPEPFELCTGQHVRYSILYYWRTIDAAISNAVLSVAFGNEEKEVVAARRAYT